MRKRERGGMERNEMDIKGKNIQQTQMAPETMQWRKASLVSQHSNSSDISLMHRKNNFKIPFCQGHKQWYLYDVKHLTVWIAQEENKQRE